MMSQRGKEQKAFAAFLEASPSLAAQIESWRVQEGAFPDVLATLHDGQEIGFELGEWLHEGQISQSKKLNQVDSNIRAAIRPQPENRTQHIDRVLLTPQYDRMRFDQQDGEKLRAELIRLIEETDEQWPGERHWQSQRSDQCSEFDRFSTLTRYLVQVWFVPRCEELLADGIPWIHIRGRGGSYSGEAAREALRNIISKKASHYGNSSGRRVNLLIHYGADAFAHNTPFMDAETPDFAATAKIASEIEILHARQLPFEKVYLCNTLSLEAYEIFHQLLKSRS